MRPRVQQLLVQKAFKPTAAASLTSPGISAADIKASKPPDMTWHDYLILLLEVGAEIEHALMVQYLYAAYSLGGDQVPEKHRASVLQWRDAILTIAKEEMGHLITLQNILRLVGGPLCLDREDYPWDSPFYPFPFKLEPLSLDSLSCYIFAEMPPEIPDTGRRYREFRKKDEKRIFEAVKRLMHGGTAHHVDTIYETIIDITAHPTLVPGSAFNAVSYETQASWDEWGKGYGASSPPPTVAPAIAEKLLHRHDGRVLVLQVASRTQAVTALQEVGGQGEAPNLKQPTQELSHFDRFLEVYQAFERLEGFTPTRNVPVNPTTIKSDVKGGPENTFIEDSQSRAWASLFNLRYRMLLTYIAHTYQLPRHTESGRSGVRPGTLHRVFAEMYNVKTIAGLLLRMPLTEDPSDPRRAGPPFEMPYSMSLPASDDDCWRLHRDLLTSSADLCHTLLAGAPPDGAQYLTTLIQVDRQSMNWIDQILAGVGSARRQPV